MNQKNIYHYIQKELISYKQEIFKCLYEDFIQDSYNDKDICFTGKITHLINSLNGYSPMIKIEIPESVSINNMIILYKNSKKWDSLETLKEAILKEAKERKFTLSLVTDYLNYLELEEADDNVL